MSIALENESHQRQVHLDFHTSPLIPDVGGEFDPREFARTFKRAHVNSVTIFAKCHHGMCYYPTKTGTQHPALKGRDLLGEMIEHLHREQIRCPIYTTVAWEEDVANRFPQWRQMRADGTFAELSGSPDGKGPAPGRWKFNNFLHPEYQDYIEAHTRELLANYDVDGLFYDIVFFHPDACWSDASIRFREQHGLMGTDRATRDRFENAAVAAFGQRFTSLVKGLQPKASVFYNTPNPLFVDATMGMRSRLNVQTHLEIESLPSGFWGYYHFPRLGRTAMNLGVPWVGMTGRFQKMWGDFGGVKPQPALEYECFRCQALGGGNSVGDQLPPRGALDKAAYSLIGAVYQQCEAAEPFYAHSSPLPQVGIFSPGFPGADPTPTDLSLEGAVQMCEESHYEAVVLDDASNLDGLDLLILPDAVVLTDPLQRQLRDFRRRGGKLLFSHRSGFDAQAHFAIDSLPLTLAGDVRKYPTYWRGRDRFADLLGGSDRVFYEPGIECLPGDGATVLVDRVLPYFKRTDLTYSSHFQTPPVAQADSHPAVVAGDNWVYFADPIFREYRKSGNIAARDVWRAAVQRLIGDAPFGAGLPTTILLSPRRRGQDLILTLLHYIPLRKALDIDIIEERMSFAGEVLRLPPAARQVRIFGTEQPLERTAAGFALPPVKGRLLLEVPGYFAI